MIQAVDFTESKNCMLAYGPCVTLRLPVLLGFGECGMPACHTNNCWWTQREIHKLLRVLNAYDEVNNPSKNLRKSTSIQYVKSRRTATSLYSSNNDFVLPMETSYKN